MKTCRTYTIFLLLLAATGFLTCSKNGAGDIISKEVAVSHFDSLAVDGMFNVFIIQDTFCLIRFVGEERNVNRCKAEFTDGHMVISGSKRGEFLHPNEKVTEVYVYVDSIKRINVREDCSIRTRTPLSGHEIGLVADTRYMEADLELNCDVFYYWNNPNGAHVTFRGQTDALKIWNAGLGTVDASALISDYVLVENGAQNDCKVHSTQTLEYSLTSIGNIIYFGNPANIVLHETTGTGSLIKGD